MSRRRHLALRPHAEQMADGEDEVGAVHRIEVEMVDPLIDEIEDLFGRHGRCDQAPRDRIIVQAFKAFGEPLRNRGAGARARNSLSA